MIKNSLNNSDLNEIVKLCEDKNIYKEYKRLKFIDTMYYLGDVIMISNADSSDHDFIGLLKKIIKIEYTYKLSLI